MTTQAIDPRFLAAWEAIDAPDRDVLEREGWTAAHLPALEVGVTGSGAGRAQRELTDSDWVTYASTVVCDWYGTLDPTTVIAWITVRCAGIKPFPETGDMRSWTREHIGPLAPYVWAAGLSFCEARNLIQARALDRDRLRLLAGLRGIALP